GRVAPARRSRESDQLTRRVTFFADFFATVFEPWKLAWTEYLPFVSLGSLTEKVLPFETLTLRVLTVFEPFLTRTFTVPAGLVPVAFTETLSTARWVFLTFDFLSLAVTLALAFATETLIEGDFALTRSALPANSATSFFAPGVSFEDSVTLALPFFTVPVPTTELPALTFTLPFAATPFGAVTVTVAFGLLAKVSFDFTETRTEGVAFVTVSLAASDARDCSGLLRTARNCVPFCAT